MTSEAIVIGVNSYEFLQPLSYAQQDALALKNFLEQEAKFDRVYYFAEDAPTVNGVSMKPTRNNLRRVMRDTFAKPFMGDGDNFWFFFSGHGMRSGERDFLMPIDGDPDDVAESGISTAQVSEWLRGCGADNVVMILDACRSGGCKDGKGIGDETREGCRQTGVISLFSCSPNQFSYELPQYEQGAFTKVLLEGLGVQGACATVARLDEYLKRRVPEVVRECLGSGVSQYPYSIAEPINKSHLILMPNHARPEDLNALKMDALRAEKVGDVRLAWRCWLRVNTASRGLDMEAIDALINLKTQRENADSTLQNARDEILIADKPLTGDPKTINWSSPSLGISVKFHQELHTEGNSQSSEGEQVEVDSADSEKDMGYAKLRKFLSSKRWKEADQETLKIMLKVANREFYGWLDADSLCDFPSKELKTIDQLWVTASNGRFGFSVQKRIWEGCGGAMTYNSNWEKFLRRIGWHNAKKPLMYENLKFSATHSPPGELPGIYDCINGNGIPATWSKPNRSFDDIFSGGDGFVLIELWCLFARDEL